MSGHGSTPLSGAANSRGGKRGADAGRASVAPYVYPTKAERERRISKVLELCAREQGAHLHDVAGALDIPSDNAQFLMGRMAGMGKLFRGPKHHDYVLRFFTTEKAARGWAFSRADYIKRERGFNSTPAPVRIPPPEFKSETVVRAGQKVTVGKAAGYDARYQCAPGERVVGGFATLGIGRYLE